MLIKSQSNQKFLEAHLPHLADCEDLGVILKELDAFITEHCFDENYDLTPLGRIAQQTLDDIYYANEDEDELWTISASFTES